MARIESNDGSMIANEFARDGMPMFGFSALYDDCMENSGEAPETKTVAQLAAEFSVNASVTISPDSDV